jgi:O-antigen ligase
MAAVFTIYRAKTSKAVFVLHILIAGLAFFTMARSGSRGQMIAMVLAAFVWLPITAKVAAKKSSILAIVFSALITIGMIYAITQSTENVKRWRWESVEHSTVGRFDQAQYLL